MTVPFWMGFVFGLFVMSTLHIVLMNSYQRILVMKAKDGSAEHINGKFYYIKEEGK